MLARLITRARAALLRRQHARETKAINRLTEAQSSLQQMQEAVPEQIDTHRRRLTYIEQELRSISIKPAYPVGVSADAIRQDIERRAKWGGVA